MTQAYQRQYGCDFISAQPTNLYGTHDNFDLEKSHVVPALLRKAHEAKLAGAPALVVWGSGNVLREFLHVDDLADALLFLAKTYTGEYPVNVGTGEELTIRELAELVCETVGFRGQLTFDASKPDGTPRKLLDVGRLHAMGWHHKIDLRHGLAQTYDWYLAQQAEGGRPKAGLRLSAAGESSPAPKTAP